MVVFRRAMIMKPPPRVIKKEPVLSERQHKEKLQEAAQKEMQKQKNRRQSECPYACGWAINQKYKKKVTL